VPAESLKNDSAYFVSLGIFLEEHLEAALGGALKITSSLLAYEADPTASIEHQRQMSQVPLTER
jgi:phosphate uptake regulator